MSTHTSSWYSGFDEMVKKYSATQKNSTEYLLELANVRRAIANFVFIATGKSIPVHFSTGQQSYANGQVGKEFIVISAEADPKKFDAMSGVALHESSHIIWSRRTNGEIDSMPLFPVLDVLNADPKRFISPELEKKAESIGDKMPELQKNFQFILNIMEDRRIDQLMYRRAIGYRPFYEAMYDVFWHSDEIAEMLQTADAREPVVRNYMAHLVSMTHEKFDPNALPGLLDMAKLIDLPNIQRFQKDKKWESWEYNTKGIKPKTMKEKFDKFPDMIQVAITILEAMYDNCIFDQKKKDAQDQADKDFEQALKEGRVGPGDPNNLDSGGWRKMTKEEQKQYKELMDKLIKTVNEGVEKKAIDQQAENDMKALETSKVQLTETGKGMAGKIRAKCIVYHKLTKQLIRSQGFIFSRGYKNADLVAAVNEGISLGTMLADKVRCIADETPISYTRKEKGHMDKRLVAGLGYDNANIFSQSVIEKHKPVLIHLTVDSSGSMSGAKWRASIKLAAALAKVAEQIKTINLVVSFRASNYGLVHILMGYDSRVDSLVKIREMFPLLNADGGTPEGLSYEAIKDHILDDKTSKKYFINISDGEPYHTVYDPTGTHTLSYTGETAFVHTRGLIREMEAAGISILSYFIQDSSYYEGSLSNFRRMYGKAAQSINVGSVTEIARTMNKMFLDGSNN